MDIEKRVHELYWIEDKNCAITTVMILSELYNMEINKQIYYGLISLPGMGKSGSTCGIVSGALIFIGIYSKTNNCIEEQIKNNSNEFIKMFVERFKSIDCEILRPEGFSENNPPHLCEALTSKAIKFIYKFIEDNISINN